EICAVKPTVASFLDDDLVWQGLQLFVDLNPFFAVDEADPLHDRRPHTAVYPHVAAVAPVGVSGEDHGHPGPAGVHQRPLERWDDYRRHVGPQRSALGDEVVLHVDDDESSLRWVDLTYLVRHIVSSVVLPFSGGFCFSTRPAARPSLLLVCPTTTM